MDGVRYTVVDTLGTCITGKDGFWAAGTTVSVILDVDKRQAYLLNPSVYNRTETLTAETKALFGLDETAVPDDVLKLVAKGLLAQGVTTITVLDEDGNPLPGVTLSGVVGTTGETVSTDSNGVALAVVPAVVEVTFSSGFADIPDYTETLSPNYSELNEITVTMPFVSAGTVDIISTSQTLKFRKAHTANLSLVGGGNGGTGGDGGYSWYSQEEYRQAQGGAGGAGGAIYNLEAYVLSGSMDLVIGAGGAGGAAGAARLQTYDQDAVLGKAGGTGGDTALGELSSSSGSASTLPICGVVAGGAGGAGGRGYCWAGGRTTYGLEGGAGTRGGGAGGDGHWYTYTNDSNGQEYLGSSTAGSAGTLGGGGGGGGGGQTKYSSDDEAVTAGKAGGAGGSGCLIIEWL